MSSCWSGCNDCPSRNTCQIKDSLPGYEDIQAAFQNKLVLCVLSGKGGVGKSTIAGSLAQALSQRMPTCLLDGDIAGPSIPRITNTLPSVLAGEHLVPAVVGKLLVVSPPAELTEGEHTPGNSMLKYLLSIDTSPFSCLVIDTPPGTSDVHITLGKYLTQLQVVLVTTGHPLSLADVSRQIDFCHKASLPIIGLVENMSEYRCPGCHSAINVFGQNGSAKALADQHAIPHYVSVPLNQSVAKLADDGTIPTLLPPDFINQLYHAITRLGN